jgi:hypothetical protein
VIAFLNPGVFVIRIALAGLRTADVHRLITQQRRENPGATQGEPHRREYNYAIPTKKPIMEAEKINALANSLSDLGARAKEMRRYL